MVDAGHRKALKSTTLTTTENVRELALPADFIKVRLLEVKVNDIWVPCIFYERYDTLVSTQNTAQVGTQNRFAYSLLGSDIILEPTPNLTGVELRLTYYYQPEELVDDTDTPDIEVVYHPILVSYCCVEAKTKEEMIGGGGADNPAFVSTYQQQLQQFINNIQLMSQQRAYAEPFVTY